MLMVLAPVKKQEAKSGSKPRSPRPADAPPASDTGQESQAAENHEPAVAPSPAESVPASPTS
jgi:hypothetical protein